MNAFRVHADDVRYWVEHKPTADEIAVRLHHRLTRFTLSMVTAARADDGRSVDERLSGTPFSWAGGSLTDVGTLRTK